jgi:hypothetical protein
MVSLMSQPLYPWGKDSWYRLNGRLGGPQSHSVHFGEEKNLLPLPGIITKTIQPSDCTDYSILALFYVIEKVFLAGI